MNSHRISRILATTVIANLGLLALLLPSTALASKQRIMLHPSQFGGWTTLAWQAPANGVALLDLTTELKPGCNGGDWIYELLDSAGTVRWSGRATGTSGRDSCTWARGVGAYRRPFALHLIAPEHQPMKIQSPILLTVCLSIVGLGAGLALLMSEPEPEHRRDASRSSNAQASTRSSAKPPTSRRGHAARREHAAPVVVPSTRTAQESWPEDNWHEDEHAEAVTSEAREAAVAARRLADAAALANRRELYAHNLDTLETAAAAATAEGEVARAQALRRRMELLSSRAREEGLD